MNSKDFYNLVKMTRYAQKKYLSAQSEIEKQGWLATNKGYEKKHNNKNDSVEQILKEKKKRKRLNTILKERLSECYVSG